MTAPVWISFPPEVHSALLSSGPGPASLLAAAGAWDSLSSEYTSVAGELAALSASVAAGAWEGPSAEQYVAANASYIEWLLQTAAGSAATATQHQTAATAYTAALAAMPTLAELAANHAAHGVLVATNFFGINTIPIAVNEADYARMWVQAATTMSTYQAVSSSAMAAVPQTTPAPQIVKMNSTAMGNTGGMNSGSGMGNTGGMSSGSGMGSMPGMGTTLPTTPEQWLQAIFPPQFNPFSPNSFQTMQPSLSTFIPRAEQMLATYANNPEQLTEAVLLLGTQFVVHRTLYLTWIVLNNPALLSTFIANNPLYSLALTAPLPPIATAPLTATSAVAAGGLAGSAGVAGLAAPTALPAVAAPMPDAAVPVAPAGGAAVTAGAAPAPVLAPVASPLTHIPPPPGVPPAPPVVGAEGAMAAHGAVAAQGSVYPYLFGDLGSPSGATVRGSAARTTVNAAKLPAAAAAPTVEHRRAPRGKRATPNRVDRGYRYEFLDSGDEPDASPDAVSPSGQGAGLLGFPGTVAKAHVEPPAGLTTVHGDTFSQVASPMLPGSWESDTEASHRWGETGAGR